MKFRKRPIEPAVVEAFHLTQENFEDFNVWPKWLLNAMAGDREQRIYYAAPPAFLTIENPFAKWEVQPNDWIVKGLFGELYPLNPKVFEETHERVE